MPTYPGGRRARGFTLLEILVALAVLSAATYIIISLFNRSLVMSQENRTQKVAAELAREQLVHIQHHPDEFAWPSAADLEGGKTGRINARDAAAQKVEFAMPAMRGTLPRIFEADRDFYGRFTWEAYARRPAEIDAAYEVTVVVRWAVSGRERQLALTTSIPRAQVEDAA